MRQGWQLRGAVLGNRGRTLQPSIHPTQIPLVYPSDAAALDVGRWLAAAWGGDVA